MDVSYLRTDDGAIMTAFASAGRIFSLESAMFELVLEIFHRPHLDTTNKTILDFI